MVNGRVRVAIFNPQDDYAQRLRGHLLVIDGVRVVGEVCDQAGYSDAVGRLRPDVVILDLDPDPQATLGQVPALSSNGKRVPILALSRQADHTLLMSALGSGIQEFLRKPIDHDQLVAAMEKVKPALESQVARTICVIGACGGAGATMVATNLGVELAHLVEKEVVVADMDFHFGQAAMLLDVHPQFTIADLLQDFEHIDDSLIDRALVRHETGVRVLARPDAFEQAATLDAAACTPLLQRLQASYGWLVTDGPLRYDPTLFQVVAGADRALLVFNLTVTSVRSVGRIIEELGRNGFDLTRIDLVANRVMDERGGLQMNQVEHTLGRDVGASIPEDHDVVSVSINMGRPLAVHAPNSPARQAIRDLATKLQEDG